jgi:hypothetical protein
VQGRSVREMLAATGSAELVYWSAFLDAEDERRLEELKTFGTAGM